MAHPFLSCCLPTACRQGVGRQLLDLVREVAEGARARMMWLTVADYNPNAIAFYNEYGFKKTQVWFMVLALSVI